MSDRDLIRTAERFQDLANCIMIGVSFALAIAKLIRGLQDSGEPKSLQNPIDDWGSLEVVCSWLGSALLTCDFGLSTTMDKGIYSIKWKDVRRSRARSLAMRWDFFWWDGIDFASKNYLAKKLG